MLITWSSSRLLQGMGQSLHFVICFHSNAFDSRDICDMIKGNESDVANIGFEILARKEFKLFCFILFSVLINCS